MSDAPKRMIAIIGGRSVNVRNPATLELAEAVGAELARLGYGVVTGGDDGVGGAACKGAVQAGGVTMALLKESDIRNCAPYITYAIPTSIDLSRSVTLNWTGEAVIAFDGGYGTLFEIALALDTSRPLIVTGEQRFLRLDNVKGDNFRQVLGNDPDLAPKVIDALRELIGAAPVEAD